MSIEVAIRWADYAERAHRVLGDRYWHGRRRLFRVADRPRLGAPHWHYWWQAHALEACVDAAVRTGAAAAGQRVADLVAGILRRNGGRIANDYYDDMAWMGLALLRADQLGVVQAGHLVRQLWVEIQAGWNDRYGGIVWRRGDTYANSSANAPSAILAARLHRLTGAEEDLDWSRRILDWLHHTLVDPRTGIVWDGVHPESADPPKKQIYTYNQATVIGADVELYRSSGDDSYLDRARRTVGTALIQLADPVTGLLPAEGDVDGGLFKGVLARYLGEFVLVSDQPHTGAAERAALATLRANGLAVAGTAATGPVGPDWAHPSVDAGSLSTHLSAVLLLETLARLDTLLPEEVVLPPPP